MYLKQRNNFSLIFWWIKNLIPLLAIATRLADFATTDLSYLLLAGYALTGRRETIQALVLAWLFKMVNLGLVPEMSTVTGYYTVLFAGALSLALRSNFLHLDCFKLFTLFLGLFLVLHALLFSQIPDVSILKAINWMLVMVVLLSAWSGLNELQRDDLQRWLFKFLILLAIMSLPFLAIPSIGYMRNGSGFQGILNHPQAFGPTMALLSALVFGRLLSQKRPSIMLIAMAFGSLILIILSESRTAGMALVFAMAFSVVFACVLRRKTIATIAPALRSKRLVALGTAVFFAFTVTGSQLSGVVNDYISKGRKFQVSGITEAYDLSRGSLISTMMDNIKERPWTGIGFGIASDPDSMVISRDPVLDLPISAPIEKGVAPLAVLEEIGVLGFLLIAIWVGILIRRAALNGMAALMVACTTLLINMGEAILFSPGGMGLLALIMLSYAANKPKSSSLVASHPKSSVPHA